MSENTNGHIPHDLDSAREKAIVAAATATDTSAPTGAEMLGKRLHSHLDQIADGTLAELTALRDHIDDQIRAIKAGRDYAKQVVDNQVEFAREAISVKLIVADAVQRVTNSIEASMPGTLARTVTTNAKRQNGEHRAA